MFKVGDYVQCVVNDETNRRVLWQYGYIVAFAEKNKNRVAVEFDNPIGGHDVRGMCEEGHGWWINTDLLTRATEPPELPKFSDEELLALFE